MTTTRDRQTGRFKHIWGVVAQWEDEAGYHEVACCDHCGKYQIYGNGEPESGYDRVVSLREANRRVPASAWMGS